MGRIHTHLDERLHARNATPTANHFHATHIRQSNAGRFTSTLKQLGHSVQHGRTSLLLTARFSGLAQRRADYQKRKTKKGQNKLTMAALVTLVCDEPVVREERGEESKQKP
jgi:hypothetical protein